METDRELRDLIYLDYHATTPVDHRVAHQIHHYLIIEFGNASSIDHEWGDRAETAVKKAAQQVAALINASPKEIIFTSGATESINLAIQGTVKALSKVKQEHKPRIAVTAVEHKAVLDVCDALQKQGEIELIKIPVNEKAQINLAQIEQICADGLDLLCVMAANNEVGTIYPIADIGEIAHRHTIPFFCDGSQAVGKIAIDVQTWNITLLAISAHKLYGPKGSGALVVQKGYPLEPIFYGGGHQRGLRSGTLNVPGIVGLGEACYLRQIKMNADETEIAQKRNLLQELLQAGIPNLAINGDLQNRLAGNLHISIPDVPNSAILARVRHKLAISTGSACSSGVETPSHVLRAMKLPENQIEGSIRIGLGQFTTDAEVEYAAQILIEQVAAIQALTR